MFRYVWFKREEREEERALYTHYYAHSMNLAVGDTIKVCLVLNDTIDNTYELTKLVKMPPKRDATLHCIQAENNSSSNNKDGEFVDGRKKPTIKLFCHNQWAVCAECINGVLFVCLLSLFQVGIYNSIKTNTNQPSSLCKLMQDLMKKRKLT